MSDPQLFVTGATLGAIAGGVAVYKYFPQIVRLVNRVEAAREKLQAVLREL